MSQLHNPLTAGAVDEYVNAIAGFVAANADAVTLESSLRAFDSGVAGAAVKQRLAQALIAVSRVDVPMTNGNVSVAITTGGTGYLVGDVIKLTGGGDNAAGAAIIVASVAEGVIDGITVTGGAGYTESPVVDTVGVGGADATFAVTFSNQQQVIDDVAASVQAAT